MSLKNARLTITWADPVCCLPAQDLIQIVDSRLPKKEIFRPAELPRIFHDFPGFSRTMVYMKMADGQLKFRRTTTRGIIIRREWIMEYFIRQESSGN